MGTSGETRWGRPAQEQYTIKGTIRILLKVVSCRYLKLGGCAAALVLIDAFAPEQLHAQPDILGWQVYQVCRCP